MDYDCGSVFDRVIGAGVGTKCLITPKYTAVSKLYVVSASGKNIVNLDDLRLGTTLSSDYTELLKTRPICNEIISDLGLDYTGQPAEKHDFDRSDRRIPDC